MKKYLITLMINLISKNINNCYKNQNTCNASKFQKYVNVIDNCIIITDVRTEKYLDDLKYLNTFDIKIRHEIADMKKYYYEYLKNNIKYFELTYNNIKKEYTKYCQEGINVKKFKIISIKFPAVKYLFIKKNITPILNSIISSKKIYKFLPDNEYYNNEFILNYLLCYDLIYYYEEDIENKKTKLEELKKKLNNMFK